MPKSLLTVEERFWAKVEKTEGCWLWMGYRNKKGYGMFKMPDRVQLAHRAAWMLTNGPIPDGLDVLHKCDNPPCVRPTMLFLGTNADNQQDSVRKGRHVSTKKTHCLQGHPLAGENLYISPNEERQCRECKRESKRRIRAQKHARQYAV
jgi:HNH endonuclease